MTPFTYVITDFESWRHVSLNPIIHHQEQGNYEFPKKKKKERGNYEKKIKKMISALMFSPLFMSLDSLSILLIQAKEKRGVMREKRGVQKSFLFRKKKRWRK